VDVQVDETGPEPGTTGVDDMGAVVIAGRADGHDAISIDDH
jgi:hypothetical protein